MEERILYELRRRPAGDWTLERLAQSCGVTPAQLESGLMNLVLSGLLPVSVLGRLK